MYFFQRIQSSLYPQSGAVLGGVFQRNIRNIVLGRNHPIDCDYLTGKHGFAAGQIDGHDE